MFVVTRLSVREPRSAEMLNFLNAATRSWPPHEASEAVTDDILADHNLLKPSRLDFARIPLPWACEPYKICSHVSWRTSNSELTLCDGKLLVATADQSEDPRPFLRIQSPLYHLCRKQCPLNGLQRPVITMRHRH
ncbi:hypothetical protein AKJ16_DCAP25027 [Drosera capensis]